MMYKIKNTETNLYLKAGLYLYSKTGKTWSSIQALKLALINRFLYSSKRRIPLVKLVTNTQNLVIEEYTENGIKTYDVYDFILNKIIPTSKTYYLCKGCNSIVDNYEFNINKKLCNYCLSNKKEQ